MRSCNEYCSTHGCNQGRNCPARIERLREAKRVLDGERPNIPLLLIGRLALAGAVLVAILVGSMYHDALRSVA